MNLDKYGYGQLDTWTNSDLIQEYLRLKAGMKEAREWDRAHRAGIPMARLLTDGLGAAVGKAAMKAIKKELKRRGAA